MSLGLEAKKGVIASGTPHIPKTHLPAEWKLETNAKEQCSTSIGGKAEIRTNRTTEKQIADGDLRARVLVMSK